MWFNLKNLSNLEKKFLNFEKTRNELFLHSKELNWNTLRYAFNLLPEYSTVTKIKLFSRDSEDYLLFLKFKNKWFKGNISIIKQLLFLHTQLNILIYNIHYFLSTKRLILFEFQNILMKKEQIYLDKHVILLKQIKDLKKIKLLFHYFILNEMILLLFYFFIFLYESVFFNYITLEKYLKTFFLRTFRVKEKLKVWSDCQWITSGSSIYFIEGPFWVKNKEIYEDFNKEFFDFIPIGILYYTWIYEFYDENRNFLLRKKKYLYLKFIYLQSLLEFNIFKYNSYKKNLYIFNFYSDLLTVKDFYKLKHRNSINNSIPDLMNRLRLKKIIIAFFYKLKKIRTREKKNFNNELLSNTDNKIFDLLFYFTFIEYIKKKYSININYLNILRKRFKKKLFYFKKLDNLKVLFIIFFKISNKKIFNLDSKIFVFLMSFYYIHIEFNIKKIWNFFNIKKDYYKKYVFTDLRLLEFLFLKKTLAIIWEYKVIKVHPFKYNLLNEALSFHYKNYWSLF